MVDEEMKEQSSVGRLIDILQMKYFLHGSQILLRDSVIVSLMYLVVSISVLVHYNNTKSRIVLLLRKRLLLLILLLLLLILYGWLVGKLKKPRKSRRHFIQSPIDEHSSMSTCNFANR
ncbi:hypothetical protein Smp_179820 [Schistosoma mansoni]|uniref:hypothetical protein n=1 Tax=Schistosoma mansoni TaxID=6183 RepID=UPI00019B37AC|nr:hypothetical protein Smp_179820 [Schistosoma mansoni]|eukprot:XP_018652843.1 hypothetical protein Smp_179820 [Schistosoma mansoni]